MNRMNDFEWMFDNSCPKCGGVIIGGDIKEHIDKCKSTLIDGAIENIIRQLEKDLMDELREQSREKD